MDTVKNSLSVLIIAGVFAAAIIIRGEPSENRALISMTVYLTSFIIILGFSWFSYRSSVNMPILYSCFALLVVLKYFVLTGNTTFIVMLSNIALGGINGLSILLMGTLLSFSSPKTVRPIILLGVIAAVLVFPVLNTISVLDVDIIRQILFFIVLIALLLFMILNRKNLQHFSPAKQILKAQSNEGIKWREILFSQNRTIQITLFMTIPFFFCLGVFRGYSLDLGYSLINSNLIMYGVAAILLILLVIDRVKQSNTFFNMLCFAIEGIYMIIIFSMLVVADYPVELFGIMRAGIIILQVWIIILLSELSLEKSVSPPFLYGIFALVYLLPNVVGDIVASYLLPISAEAIPMLVGGALMTIAIAAVIIILLLINSRSPDMSSHAFAASATLDKGKASSEDSATRQKDEHILAVCKEYGLTEKESEVISLYSQGRSVRNISSKLYISESTTRTYIQRAYTKLNIHNRQQLLDILDEAKEVTR